MTKLNQRFCAIAFALLFAAAGCHKASTIADAGFDAGQDAGQDAGGNDSGTDAGIPDAGDGGVQAIPIVISEVFPAEGPISGGTNVLITGSGFVEGFAATGGGAVSAQTQVQIGGVAAPNINVIDDNRMQASTPAGAPGSADLTITNPNGTQTCSGCFRYLAHVEIDSVTPASGPASGGISLTIKGAGFDSDLIVTIGGAPLIAQVLVDSQTVTGTLPPGAAGPAEVAATSRDGRASDLGGFIYQDTLALTDIQPRLVATAGGAVLRFIGQGFAPQATVSFDGALVPSYWIDSSHLGAIAPAHAAGVVSVTVTNANILSGVTPATSTIARGLVYGDLASTLPGPLALESLWPTHGPISGGTCPAACLHLEGSGFTASDLAITIGGQSVGPSTIHLVSDEELSFDLPAGLSPGAVEVDVSSASEGASGSGSGSILASDPGAFHYDPTFAVSSIDPASGPATGSPAVMFTLRGNGLNHSDGAPLELRIGALDATNVVVDPSGTTITGIAPAGSPGVADITAIATDADGTTRTAVLPGAFTFTSPLALLQVSPSSGAQSGGERVSLYGNGFAPGLAVTFGALPATQVQVISSSEASCAIPAGVPGVVDVVAMLGAASDALHNGFTYFNPTSNNGGTSGANLQGSLNITVIDESVGSGLLGAQATATLDDGGTISGFTNANGQVTLSDPRLVLSTTVVVTKPTYNTVTTVDVAVSNLTVFLIGPFIIIPPPPSDAGPPPPPPPPPVGTISGHVFGFKVPPTLVLNSNQRIVAYVRIPAGSIYAGPPFSTPGTPIKITTDGGGFSFQTQNFDPIALYAQLGVETTTGPSLTTFAPLLLGVLRGVQPIPNGTVSNADILLDTHLDQTVNASTIDPPDPGPGNTLLHQAAVDLDLGSAGLVPLASVQSTSAQIAFAPLPAAEGQGFIFIDQVTNGTAESVYLRRIFSDVLQGITLGPYLPFPLLDAPLFDGPPFDGTFRWRIGTGLQPNLMQLRADAALADGSSVSWSVVMPGTARSVAMPAVVIAELPSGTSVAWTVTASYAPGFNYDFWSYSDLAGTGWVTYAYGFSQYTVP